MTTSPAKRIEVHSFTAVFTTELDVTGLDKHDAREALEELVSSAQSDFANQWDQTKGSGLGWTVTIHDDDPIERDPYDIYGTPEHESVLIEEERRGG